MFYLHSLIEQIPNKSDGVPTGQERDTAALVVIGPQRRWMDGKCYNRDQHGF